MSENHESQQNDSIDSLRASLKHFGNADYMVFTAMLLSCTVVGLYFGYQDYKRKKHAKIHRRGSEAMEYLMGGRNMKIFPVAMSLVASCISGVALLGTSTEIYLYGYQYGYILIGYLAGAVVTHYIIIPIFHELQITSAYEYLQMRFDKKVRLFGSAMYSLSTILWMPLAIYVPALAFSQTTGMGVHVITIVIMVICIFYTCLGGIKAVVWTDVIQIMIMYGTLVIINVKGTFDAGGLGNVIQRNIDSGRLAAPDFRIDPTIRLTFWTQAIGGTFMRIYFGLNQSMIQRFMALKNVRVARKCQLTYIIGIFILNLMCYYNGLLLYAKYYDCDPLTTKLAKAKDQIMPLFVMDILKNLPGLSGLFIAGVFSASLSSLSTALNSFAAVMLEDFCKPYTKTEISEKKSAIIMRGTVLIVGAIGVGLVYVVQHMGSVLQLALSIPTVCFGPMLGVYIIGMLIPWIAKRATLYGALTGCAGMMAYVFKVQIEIARGNIKYQTKPVSIEGCTYEYTTANITNVTSHESEGGFFELSFMYYTILGVTFVIVSSVIYSFIFGFNDPYDVDLRLLAPFIRKYFAVDDNKNECEMTEVEMPLNGSCDEKNCKSGID